MIKANELRIGSMVIVDKNGNIGEVLAIYQQNYETVCSVKYDDPKYHLIGGYKTVLISDLSPIPITPEVLERCGFIKYGQTPFFSYRLKVNSLDELAWYSQDCELRYQTIGSGFTRNFNIKYLYQLQNLVFALTGQELKIMEQ